MGFSVSFSCFFFLSVSEFVSMCSLIAVFIRYATLVREIIKSKPSFPNLFFKD